MRTRTFGIWRLQEGDDLSLPNCNGQFDRAMVVDVKYRVTQL